MAIADALRTQAQESTDWPLEQSQDSIIFIFNLHSKYILLFIQLSFGSLAAWESVWRKSSDVCHVTMHSVCHIVYTVSGLIFVPEFIPVEGLHIFFVSYWKTRLKKQSIFFNVKSNYDNDLYDKRCTNNDVNRIHKKKQKGNPHTRAPVDEL